MVSKIKFIYYSVLIIFIVACTSPNEDRNIDEAKGLSAGDNAPVFTAEDQHKNIYDLEKKLKDGPVVLIFYRGHWCPVCNRHLSSLQDSLQMIYNAGASVVAVSPEKPQLLKKTAEKTNVSFSLLYDKDYKISNAYDVTFLPDSAQRAMYDKHLDADLKKAHSDESQRLPIPATYIISTDGKIVWRQFNRE